MSTSFKNCEAGTFYGWEDDKNNKFQPGDTVLLQWGAFDDESTPLNISLTRPGGALVSDILGGYKNLNSTCKVVIILMDRAEGALFSIGGSIYRTTNFSSSNCTLDQYNWTIPLSFNTTDPKYQLGLFNASTTRGTDGNNLWGFLSWSEFFYVEATTTTTTTAGTATATATATATKTHANNNQAATTTSSIAPPPTSSSSSGLSGGAKAGIGVGVTLGVLALVGVFVFIIFRRKRAAGYRNTEAQILPAEMNGATENKPPKQALEVHEMDGVGVSEPQELDGGNIYGYK